MCKEKNIQQRLREKLAGYQVIAMKLASNSYKAKCARWIQRCSCIGSIHYHVDEKGQLNPNRSQESIFCFLIHEVIR